MCDPSASRPLGPRWSRFPPVRVLPRSQRIPHLSIRKQFRIQVVELSLTPCSQGRRKSSSPDHRLTGDPARRTRVVLQSSLLQLLRRQSRWPGRPYPRPYPTRVRERTAPETVQHITDLFYFSLGNYATS